MKKRIIKAVKISLLSFAALIVIGVGTFITLMFISKQPASMNMGAMDSMNRGAMDSMAMSHTMPAAGAMNEQEVSLTSLTEKPSDAPVKTYDLEAVEKKIDTGSGKTVDAWTYNGAIPGPEIHVQQGDRVVVHLHNRLPEGVTIHWHGVDLPNANDGVAGLTQDAVPPGGDYTYDFVVNKPGIYWYHSHQFSDMETTKGLYGVLIVDPKQPAAHYDRDYTAVLHDWNANNSNIIDTINGTSDGEHFDAKPGDLVRLSIVNTASTTHFMTLVGAPFKVIAIDAGDIHGPTELNGSLLPIAASQRFDLEFTMPASGPVKLVNADQTGFVGNFFTKLLGFTAPSAAVANQMLTATFGNGDIQPDIQTLQQQPMFDFMSYGSPADEADSLTLDSKFNRQYEMNLGNAMGFFNGKLTMTFKINKETFPNVPSYMVKEGDLVKIHIVNDSDIPHPMHLHGHAFKVLAKNGVALTHSPIYLNTLDIGEHTTYDIGFIANNPGLWMIHCHNLVHAASGMDMMLNYEGVTTPFTVGNQSGNHPD